MRKRLVKIGTYGCLLLLLVVILVFVKAWIDGKFTSVETFQQYMENYGFFAPIMLAVFQAVQVVLPVLPGFLGCAVGAMMFGANVGFWCNYIGISVGSLIAFGLARKYGSALVSEIFKSKRYDRWTEKAANSKSYAAFMFVATLLPLFPDDYLCYFSGLTKMTFRRFFWIIVIGKPWCILAYSLGFSLIK